MENNLLQIAGLDKASPTKTNYKKLFLRDRRLSRRDQGKLQE